MPPVAKRFPDMRTEAPRPYELVVDNVTYLLVDRVQALALEQVITSTPPGHVPTVPYPGIPTASMVPDRETEYPYMYPISLDENVYEVPSEHVLAVPEEEHEYTKISPLYSLTKGSPTTTMLP